MGNYLNVCGIDEAGRGPLAGPVVAACVCIPQENWKKRFWSKVNDSKQLQRHMREELFEYIREFSFWGIGQCSVEEIDELNIHHATLLAMKRAYEAMKLPVEQALIDGKFAPALPCKTETVIGGDALHLPIAAASIIAKVTRDRIMWKLHEEHPLYRWNTNVGYATDDHREAIRLYGITIHHRKSYEPCRQRILL